jgi:AraC-like DNA-binding protein
MCFLTPPPVVSAVHEVTETADPDEAREVVERAFLPHRMELLPGATPLHMQLDVFRLGSTTVGRLRYGRDVRLRTDDTSQLHINIPLHGHSLSRSGTADPVLSTPERAALFPPERPADILWGGDLTQLCLMIPRTTVEQELDLLVGGSLHKPVQFPTAMDLTTPFGRAWRETLNVLLNEYDHRPGLATHLVAGRRLERLLLDGLLLGTSHSYSDVLHAPRPAALPSAVRRAVELLEEQPQRAWSTAALAAELFISVRSLQEGFRRHVGKPPMVYLRDARLRRIHDELVQADPRSATVAMLASRWGVVHMSRFAGAYRAKYGTTPSATLRRPPVAPLKP